MSIYANKYVPPYQEEYGKLHWYERNMMSYIDYLKYERIKNNADVCFKEVKIINFDIINHECRGDKLQRSYKDYKTIEGSHLTNYPKNESKIVMSGAFRNNRDDLWVRCDLMLQYFKETFK